MWRDSEGPVSAEEIWATHDSVRKRFVSFLAAEAEKLGNFSNEYEALEKARLSSKEADKEAIAQAQKALFDRSTQAWSEFSQGVITDFGSAFYDMLCYSACNIDPLSRGIGVQN